MPQRVQRTRIKGRPGIPPGAVYVGRGSGSKWGNPFNAYDSSPTESAPERRNQSASNDTRSL